MEYPHERLDAIAVVRWTDTDSFAELWQILQEFPGMNFDDFSPKTEASFCREMKRRLLSGEWHWAVKDHGRLIGAIGILPVGRWAGLFHGIAFRKEYHGTGIAKRAVAKAMEEMRIGRGIEAAFALYYPWNLRAGRFLSKLGFYPVPYSQLFQQEPFAQQDHFACPMRVVRCDLSHSPAEARAAS